MKKIGILDSGIGGLSLLNEILSQNFLAEYYYISDNENMPYGNKSQDFMLKRIRVLVQKLLDKNVEAIIIACNTATAETIDKLRVEFDLPFFGIEPYINYLNHSHDENLALILTEATYNSKRFQLLTQKLDSNNKVKIFPLKNLALTIEKLKEVPFSEIEKDVYKELSFIKKLKLNSLILGCTHYPLISSYIEKEFNIKTVDPAYNVILHIKNSLKLESTHKPIKKFYYNQNASDHWNYISIKYFSFFN